MQGTMGNQMRRHSPGTFFSESQQGACQSRSALMTGGGKDPPVGETSLLQAMIVDGVINCSQTGHGLFIGMFEKGRGERLA